MKNSSKLIFKNSTYDTIKWIAVLLIPFLKMIVSGFGDIWGIPYADKISASLDVASVALGFLIGSAYLKYKAECVDENGNVKPDCDIETK